MVAGAFPVAKLGLLFFKQISKPIANYAKEKAKKHPFFRKYFCMPPAQLYNWCEIKGRMWLLNLGKPVNVPKLNEAQAIELGGDLIGETVVFLFGATGIWFEWSRQRAKTVAKEKEDEERIQNLQSTIMELCIQAERTEAQLRELQRHIYELDSRVVKKPWTPSQLPSAQNQSNSSQLSKEENVITEAINYIEKDILNGSNNRNIPQRSG